MANLHILPYPRALHWAHSVQSRAIFPVFLILLALTACANSTKAADTQRGDQSAFLKQCEDWDDWEKPVPPFRIYGNTYYVGTCGISAILVAGDDGHILIDGGSRGGGPLVEASIARLGFHIEDVKILLHSHEHYDHVGGLAYLQKKSGAQVIASHGAAKAMASGSAQADDPQASDAETFEAVEVASTVGSYDFVSLGKLTLIPLETPGHTPGSLSWNWWSCEKTDCRLLVYMDSLTPVSSGNYRFSDHPDYVSTFEKSLSDLAKAPCDVLLTPHPSASKMLDRMQSDAGLATKADCSWYPEAAAMRLRKRLGDEGASQ